MHRAHLLIRGRVQGVGFRYFVVHEARALGLGGTVRNRADGAVEVEAEGDILRLRELVDAVRRGPTGARVSGVEESWSEGPARYRDFCVTHEGSLTDPNSPATAIDWMRRSRSAGGVAC